jgi:hypothetical protein
MSLIDRNDEIQAFAPDGPNDSLAESIGGRCSDRSSESANTEIPQRRIDSGGENRVAVMDHESMRIVECQKLAELLNRPFRG